MIKTKQQHVADNAAFLCILGFMVAMFGLIAMLAPFAAGLEISLVLGVLVLGRAAMQLYYGFKVRHWGHVIGTYMGMGSIIMSNVSVACATVLLLEPFAGIGLTRLVVCVYLVLCGGFDLLHALELRPVAGWGVVFGTAAISVGLGASIWFGWPAGGVLMLGAGLGGSFIVSGIGMAALGLMAQSQVAGQGAAAVRA